VSGEARAERSGPSGEGAPGSAPRKEGQGEKRSPSMTKPVTNNGEITKDDLISSFERRFESGN
jgi:hypothetical protein